MDVHDAWICFIEDLFHWMPLPPMLVLSVHVGHFVLNHLTFFVIKLLQIKTLACLMIHKMPWHLEKIINQVEDLPAKANIVQIQPDNILVVRVASTDLPDVSVVDRYQSCAQTTGFLHAWQLFPLAPLIWTHVNDPAFLFTGNL